MATNEINELHSVLQIDGKDYSVVASRIENKLTIKGNDTSVVEFDGSTAKAVNITGTGATSVTTADNTIIINSTNTHNKHAIISGKKADGSTDIKGTTSDGDLTLADSGVTAGEYGPTANQTPGYGETFSVPDIKVNSKGIVTSITNKTVKIPVSDNTDTHYTTKLVATTSSGTAHAATTNGNTYLRLFDDSTARQSIKIVGTGATTVSTDANGVITINSTGGGQVDLSGYATEDYVDEAINNLEEVIPTRTGQLTNDSGYLTSIPVTLDSGDTFTTITISKNEPSNGSIGDIWFKY